MRRILMTALASLVPWAPVFAQPQPMEQGRYVTYLLQHEVGGERYIVMPNGKGGSLTTISATLSDRGSTRSGTTTLSLEAKGTPTSLIYHRGGAPADELWTAMVDLKGGKVTVVENGPERTFTPPPVAFVGFSQVSASLQMQMMRYWLAHGSPAKLPLMRASAKAPPIEIRKVGEETVKLPTGPVHLTRYTIANLMFGREVVWMDDQGRLAALMTFAGGLPVEQVLEAYNPAFDQLTHSGVRQEMADLDDLDRQVKPEAEGAYAIAGARLIDATGAPAVPDSVVIVRDGRIAAAGPRASTPIPFGMRVVTVRNMSLLPGLWEMHSHYSGVEFGPALLAAGVTTARDCGGEFGFLTTVRDKIDADPNALSPRLVMAGLIDSGGILGFGKVDAETPAEGAAAVDRYAEARFQQIKVYTQLKSDVLRAISAEAHRRGLTVTGHVPAAVDAFEGVEDGMDQINHLQFVTRAMLPKDAAPGAQVDLNSDRAKALIALLKSRQIVVDPTDGWGEMAGHPKSVGAVSFEPGLKAAPDYSATRFEQLGGAGDAAKWRERMAANGRAIKALSDAGVPIVAGSDTNLIGYGLDREMELYVEAGLTPMQAIQTATINGAKAMKQDRDYGTVEVGKHADLVLVEGDPLANISDIRRVVKVVKAGRMYDSIALGRLVGFERTHTP